jgi:hypothetical protein
VPKRHRRSGVKKKNKGPPSQSPITIMHAICSAESARSKVKALKTVQTLPATNRLVPCRASHMHAWTCMHTDIEPSVSICPAQISPGAHLLVPLHRALMRITVLGEASRLRRFDHRPGSRARSSGSLRHTTHAASIHPTSHPIGVQQNLVHTNTYLTSL